MKRQPYTPTPEQIDAACRAIRGEWSDDERRKRAVVGTDPEPWTVPHVRVPRNVSQ